MRSSTGWLVAVVLVSGLAVSARQTAVDVGAIGPQIGATAPAFSGTDQFGRTHSLASVLGPKGAMLVFFRSADW